MSSEGEKIVEAARRATQPTAQDQDVAWSRLQANLRTSGVVTRKDIRWHRVRWMWRGILRCVVIGGTLSGLLYMGDKTIQEMASDRMLARAQNHLDQQRPDSAYRLLVRHAKQHPTREGAQARIPLVLDSLCDMGMEDRAAHQLEEFLLQVPDSEHASRAADICQGRTPLPEFSPVPEPEVDHDLATPSPVPPPAATAPTIPQATPQADPEAQPLQGGDGAIEIEEAPMTIRPGKDEPTRFFSTLEGPVAPAPQP